MTEEHTNVEAEARHKEQTSALDVLLGATAEYQTATVTISKRKGLSADLELKVRNLTDKEMQRLNDQALEPLSKSQRRAGGERKLDQSLYLRLVTAAGTIDPDLSDPSLTERHGVMTGADLVEKLFLPGEVLSISDAILGLSGYGEDTVKVAADL